MSVNGTSMIFGFAFWVIEVLICCNTSYMMYWQLFQAKPYVKSSLPYLENEHQRSLNNFQSFKSGNCKVIW